MNDAAGAFREFFHELREAFYERETLFTQIELALLCREHVLVTGPPGTAKSAIASAVLGRITDADTGKPSLFAKQISELTVQTDLIGAVDFKILTETGRTEYITDEGMLGATHAFLDEVFDGRDMLLRSILNVLHERELKHGKKVTPGRTECVIMTSNRYLSEVLARSPELLLAFADRLSFISFVPKAFSRQQSRASMLQKSATRQRTELRAQLTLQQLDVLQRAVENVHVSSVMVEALENLADKLEKELLKQVARLPDYVPTKYFSHRSIVKALWALKAAVVHDRIFNRPDRALEVTARDFDALRSFFLLGGPTRADVEVLVKSAVDPREKAQLEVLRVEHKAFDDALSQVLADTSSGVVREAQVMQAQADFNSAEAQVRNFQPALALELARSLRAKLIPGPRHPDNRNALLAAARMLATALDTRLSRGMAAQGEGRGGVQLHAALRAGLELLRDVPELSERAHGLAGRAERFCAQAQELIALAAEGAEFEGTFEVDQLSGLAQSLCEELEAVGDLMSGVSVSDPDRAARLLRQETLVRVRAAKALRRRAEKAMGIHKRAPDANLDEVLISAGHKLTELEAALVALSPTMKGMKQELLAPLGREYALQVLTVTEFLRTEQFAHAVRKVAERLRQEGLDAEYLLGEARELIEQRLQRHAQALPTAVQVPTVPASAAVGGDAYLRYRQSNIGAVEGEFRGLIDVEAALGGDKQGAAHLLAANLKQAVANAELASVDARLRYLRSWFAALLQRLPDPAHLAAKPEAEQAFDALVRSRFPLLTMKEGELVRLSASLSPLTEFEGPIAASARDLDAQVKTFAQEFSDWSKRLLEARARL